VTASRDITLGLLAGGAGSRLGGVDKAWLQRSGVPQVLRLAKRLSGETASVLVSANRNLARYAEAGLVAIPDRHADIGPIAGLDTLAAACATPWMLTLPVDLVDVNDCLLRSLAAAGIRAPVAR
jgi:molybdopterin-guanine dinucleotide biosynthesis protein A